jgi:xylulokinase
LETTFLIERICVSVYESTILAVDIGTSSSRATLYTLDGKQVAVSSVPNPPVHFPHAGWAEQSAEDIWSAFVQILKNLTEKAKGIYEIRAMAISAHLGTVCADEAGNLIYPLFNWMDQRAASEAVDVERLIGQQQIYSISGKRLDPERDLCRILWLKNNHPELWQQVRWVYSLKDFLVHRLTGKAATDPVHASYTLLYDTDKQEWNHDFCKAVGLDPEILPPVFQSSEQVGRVSHEMSEWIGLPQELPVISGGPDGTLAMLGAGLHRAGDAGVVMGTSDVFFVCVDQRIVDQQQRLLSHQHVIPGTWLIGGPQGLAGGAFSWLKKNLAFPCNEDDLNRWMEEEVLRILPGAQGLFFIPSFTGERAPLWQSQLRGAIVGLTPVHDTAHILRAFMEGLAFRTMDMVAGLDENGCLPKRIIATGGGANSDVRPQITADVTGIEVVVTDNMEASSVGAAILAGLGLGVLNGSAVQSWIQVHKVYSPNMENHAAYKKLYSIWKKWRNLQNETMADLK